MGQLKFDAKTGNLLPQKISYTIKPDEETKESIKQTELEKELLKGLKALGSEDRTIKNLTIWSNPNYCYGPDYLIREKIEKTLKNLIDQGIVKREKSPKGRDIFSLIKSKNMKKKGV